MLPTVRILRACTNCSRPWVLRVFAHECVNRFDENTTSMQIDSEAKASIEQTSTVYTNILMYIYSIHHNKVESMKTHMKRWNNQKKACGIIQVNRLLTSVGRGRGQGGCLPLENHIRSERDRLDHLILPLSLLLLLPVADHNTQYKITVLYVMIVCVCM